MSAGTLRAELAAALRDLGMISESWLSILDGVEIYVTFPVATQEDLNRLMVLIAALRALNEQKDLTQDRHEN